MLINQWCEEISFKQQHKITQILEVTDTCKSRTHSLERDGFQEHKKPHFDERECATVKSVFRVGSYIKTRKLTETIHPEVMCTKAIIRHNI